LTFGNSLASLRCRSASVTLFDACSWDNISSVGLPPKYSNNFDSFFLPMSPTICASRKVPPAWTMSAMPPLQPRTASGTSAAPAELVQDAFRRMLRLALGRRRHDRSSHHIVSRSFRSENAVEDRRPDVPLASVMRDLREAQAIKIEPDCLQLAAGPLESRHAR